jgi:hypothetical protein
LQHDLEDTIVWKLTKDGHYTAASAYKLQFFGLIHSEMNNMCGKLGHLQSAKTTLGLPSKIGFGRPTAWRSGDGIIAVFVLFASKQWNRKTISSSIVASLGGLGNYLRSGLGFMASILVNGSV